MPIKNIYNISQEIHETILIIVNATWYSNKTKNLLYIRLVELLILNNSPILMKEEFKQWFVGFLDAESSLMINLRLNTRKYDRCEFIYSLELHKDDKNTLIRILNELEINNTIYNKKNSSYFRISNNSLIKDILIPIFEKYPLLTKKNYDYNLWIKAINLYEQRIPRKTDHNHIILEKIAPIAKEINTFGNINNYPSIEKVNSLINPLWILGFIEGENSFHINKDFLIGFKLAQRKESISVLQAIYNILINLPLDNNCSININHNKSKGIYKDGSTTKLQISLGYNDFFYWKLIPWLLNYPFQTRKGIDFILWVIIVLIKQHGLHKYNISTSIIEDIRNNHNHLRYHKNNLPSIINIVNLFKLPSIYTKNLTQDQNARKHRNKIYYFPSG